MRHDPAGSSARPASQPVAMQTARSPWCSPPADVVRALRVDPARGLSPTDVADRRRRFGANELAVVAARSLAAILLDQFRSVVVLLLAAAGALAIAFGELLEGLAILVVVLINSGIGFVTEWRATRSMETLRRMGRVETVVLRDAGVHRIPAEELVPGDIVLCEAGDIVTADLRVLEGAKLQANEAALTGEALPVRKGADTLEHDVPLMERRNMLYKGTAVTRGSGKGVVVATGRATELGRIAELVSTAEPEETPLEKRLDALGTRLAVAVGIMAVLIAVGGIVVGRELLLAVEVAIALAVAAIPEGLPVVATIALARGMWRMARRNAVIARLSAVETLGTTSVIVTDKTGTLTENRMTVTELIVGGRRLRMAEACGQAGSVDSRGEGAAVGSHGEGVEPDLPLRRQVEALLAVGALCSNAALRPHWQDETGAVGDPTEVALLYAAARCGLSQAELRQRLPELRELPFDPDTKLMATLHADGDRVLVAVKGAPEAVFACCTRLRVGDAEQPFDAAARQAADAEVQALGDAGLRTLALAEKHAPVADAEPCADLTLLGVVGLEDPARPGVAEAVARCRAAGIRVVMVTGDHAATAREIARDVGIIEAEAPGEQFVDGSTLPELLARMPPGTVPPPLVVSRATPEQKLDLIGRYQRAGEVVAMTGDGVNDAPALRKADIGVAMGVRGTAVAKEAAAMVLQDDEFGTIVEAVAQGRAIYENIRKFVVYLLSCNISEVLVVTLATLAGAPLPLLPLQILFLNLVTDVFPALALGVGRGSPTLMRERPRPADEALLTRRHWVVVAVHGVSIALTVLASMAIAVKGFGFDARAAVTVSFCTLAFAQLWHVFNMRNIEAGLFTNEVSRNPWIWAALVLCVVLVLAAVHVPLFADVLSLTGLATEGWLLVVGMSLLPLWVGSPLRRLARRIAAAADAR